MTLAGPAAFTITGDTCRSLAPGKTCTVTVRFTPASSGTVTATLTATAKKKVAINEAPLTGGPVTTLVSGQVSPVGVAVSP